MIVSSKVSSKRKDCYQRIAKVVPVAIPLAMLAGESHAAIYTNTTPLSITVTGNSSLATTQVSGGGVNLGTLKFQGFYGSYAAIYGNGFSWKAMSQADPSNISWFGGLPVKSGKSWNNPDRNGTEFPGFQSFTTNDFGDINFGQGTNSSDTFLNDPQRVEDESWYLLFKTNNSNPSPDLYGWLSFDGTMNVALSARSIEVTGWGFESDGTTIAAGATSAGGAVPEPSSMATLAGLAALAAGAAGVRRVRKKKKIADSDASNQLAS